MIKFEFKKEDIWIGVFGKLKGLHASLIIITNILIILIKKSIFGSVLSPAAPFI